MADVEIRYKGNIIAGLDGTCIETLETAETYCESDIEVSYAPRSRIYDITMSPDNWGGSIDLVPLDDEVLEHINDDSFVASLVKLDGIGVPSNQYWSLGGAAATVVATNKPQFTNRRDGDIYGVELSYVDNTTYVTKGVIVPAKQFDYAHDNEEGGGSAYFYISDYSDAAQTWLDGIWYVLMPNSTAFVGTYRLTFTW